MMDLNLFHIFDAIMLERHVGRAAEKLGRTQPAVSNAIRRLRGQLNDQLFVRTPNGVRPTPKAEELWREISPALDALRASTGRQTFEPRQIVGTLTIACTDFEATLLLKQILASMASSAPAININLIPGGNGPSQAALQSGVADVAIGFLPTVQSTIRTRLLFEDEFCTAMRKNHPLAKGQLMIEDFAACEHILVNPTGERRGFIDELLSSRNLVRRVALVVNHFHLMPEVLLNSDLVGTVSRKLIRTLNEEKGLALKAPPFSIPPIQINLYWHRRTDTDQRLSWLRKLLIGALSKNQ
jgi:DNA-binding transcriptional LysR family regulator